MRSATQLWASRPLDVRVDQGRRRACFEGVDELGRERAASARHHEFRRRQWFLQVGKQRLELVQVEPAGLPQHHHPAVGQERRRLAGVPHGGDVELLAGEVLQHQGTFGRPDQLLHQLATASLNKAASSPVTSQALVPVPGAGFEPLPPRVLPLERRLVDHCRFERPRLDWRYGARPPSTPPSGRSPGLQDGGQHVPHPARPTDVVSPHHAAPEGYAEGVSRGAWRLRRSFISRPSRSPRNLLLEADSKRG